MAAPGTRSGHSTTVDAPPERPGEARDAEAIAAGLAATARLVGASIEAVALKRMAWEALRGWPGTLADQWWKWLIEAGRSAGCHLRMFEISRGKLSRAAATGLRLFVLAPGGTELAEVVAGGRSRGASSGNAVDLRELPETVVAVVVEGRVPDDHAEPHAHSPLQQLWKLIQPEWKDIVAVVAMSVVAGLLMISVPVAAQQLVRAVTFATLYQPVVVLSLMLLALLSFGAVLHGLQIYVAEIIQRRLFIRVAAAAAARLPQVPAAVARETFVPEVLNRFLDVVIVQKQVAALLVDGVSIVLATVIGLTVMAFYHPFLLGYGIALLLLLALAVLGLGWGGVGTAVSESRAKYQVMAWLEDVARCPTVFRTHGVDAWARERTDVLCRDYLRERRGHFCILMRQIAMLLAVQALATTGLLGLGGYLVLQEQLTLGQLVAAELIVAVVVASFAKLGKHIEGWYDLLAAADKLSYVTDLPADARAGLVGLSRHGPARVEIRKRRATPDDSALILPPGSEAVVLNGDSALLADLRRSWSGDPASQDWMLLIDGVDLADLRPDVALAHAAIVDDVELLQGSIMENVHLNRPEATELAVQDALADLGLIEELRSEGLSLSSTLLPSGRPLSADQMRRVILARALVGRPRLLIIDHFLDACGDDELHRLAPQLRRLSGATLLVLTAQRRVAQCFPARSERGEGFAASDRPASIEE